MPLFHATRAASAIGRDFPALAEGDASATPHLFGLLDRLRQAAAPSLAADISGVTQHGTWGADLLRGAGGADLLWGQAGNDTISGGDGADSLFGGAGNDLLRAGYGDDQVFGHAGADTLLGGADADRLSGGAGADVLVGGHGADQLFGGGEADTIHGGSGSDRLRGGDGDDQLRGEAGQDTLSGGAGNDALISGSDFSHLFGGYGDDVLVAQTRGGGHILHGGAGADRFVFQSGAGPGGRSSIISDFTPGLDRLVVNARTLTLDDLPEGMSLRETARGSLLHIAPGHEVLLRDFFL